MEDKQFRANSKRPFPEDDDGDENNGPAQKRVRFPKGKKVKPGNEKVDIIKINDDGPDDIKNPRLAAKERAKLRNQITADLLSEEGNIDDVSAAEVYYEDNETFVDDGIQIEPFNLTKEREEGYFDAAGNFVYYIGDKEDKDAWLNSVDFDPKLAGKSVVWDNTEDDVPDLTSKDIGKIKRRIADALEPGETVLQALRRLKGTSNNKKEKMSVETKVLFDQLTDDAMKLMENGDYNVYHEKKEVFQREAEGYERLALARGEVTSVLPELCVGPSAVINSEAGVSSNNDDGGLDMFAEDDEKAAANPVSVGNLVSAPNPDGIIKPSDSGAPQNDYIYDESSGYYYSSSLGYYYDPSSGLYCYAASGKWYSFNEQTGTYDEVQEALNET